MSSKRNMEEMTTICVSVQNGEHLLSGPDWLKIGDSKTLIDALVEVSGTHALGQQVQVVISKEPSFTEAALVQVLNPISMLRISGSIYVKFMLKSSVLPVEHKYVVNKCKAERDTDVTDLNPLRKGPAPLETEKNNIYNAINLTFEKPFESNYLNKLFSERKLSPSTILSIQEELGKKQITNENENLTTWQLQGERVMQHSDEIKHSPVVARDGEKFSTAGNNSEAVDKNGKHCKTPCKGGDKFTTGGNDSEAVNGKMRNCRAFCKGSEKCDTARNDIEATVSKANAGNDSGAVDGKTRDRKASSIQNPKKKEICSRNEKNLTKCVISDLEKSTKVKGKSTGTIPGKAPVLKAKNSASTNCKIRKVLKPSTVVARPEKKDMSKSGMPILCHKSTTRAVARKTTNDVSKEKEISKNEQPEIKTSSGSEKADVKGSLGSVKSRETVTNSAILGSRAITTQATSISRVLKTSFKVPGKDTACQRSMNDKDAEKNKKTITRTAIRPTKVGFKKNILKDFVSNRSTIPQKEIRDNSTKAKHESDLKAEKHKSVKLLAERKMKDGNKDSSSAHENKSEAKDEKESIEVTVVKSGDGLGNEDSGFDISICSVDSIERQEALIPGLLGGEDICLDNLSETFNIVSDSKENANDRENQNALHYSSGNSNTKSLSTESRFEKDIFDRICNEVQTDMKSEFQNDANLFENKIITNSVNENKTIPKTPPDDEGSMLQDLKLDKHVLHCNEMLQNATGASEALSYVIEKSSGWPNEGILSSSLKEFRRRVDSDDSLVSKTVTMKPNRSQFFCSLLDDDSVTTKLRSSYDSFDFIESSEVQRKASWPDLAVKRSESLNESVRSPCQKKSGFFHYLKEITIDIENGIADNDLFNEKYGNLLVALNSEDVFVKPVNSVSHEDKFQDEGLVFSCDSNMLNVTIDRDTVSDVTQLPRLNTSFETENVEEKPQMLSEIARDSAISRTFTLDDDEVVDNAIMSSESNPNKDTANQNNAQMDHTCNGTIDASKPAGIDSVKSENISQDEDGSLCIAKESMETLDVFEFGKDVECHIRRKWSTHIGIMDQLLLASVTDLTHDLNVTTEKIMDKMREKQNVSHNGLVNSLEWQRSQSMGGEQLFHNLRRLEKQLGIVEEMVFTSNSKVT